MQHIVMTRLGTGIYRQSWYDSAISLFQAVTLPSVKAQRFERFIWLVVVDHAMPQAARARLAGLLDDERFHLVPIDLTRLPVIRYASAQHIWDRCRDYLFAQRLVTDPFDYIATSGIDADDAWHVDTLHEVDTRFTAALPQVREAESRTKGLLRHTSGMALTSPRGLRWYPQADVVTPLDARFYAMSVFVLARLSSGISAHSSRHGGWSNYARVLDFRVDEVRPDCPMWVYVRHDRAQVPWAVDRSANDPGAARQLRTHFAIDFDRIAAWRSERDREAVPGNAMPDTYPPYPHGDQIDTYFRITAVNQQIAALRDQLRVTTEHAEQTEIGALLKRQQGVRDDLVATLAAQGQNLFR